MDQSHPTFTAAQIANCLDRTPQAIRKALRDVKPAAVRVVYGKEAAAWTVASLPAGLRCQLDAVAMQRRYRNTAAMLANPPKQWEPALPLNQIADRELDQANKLRAALLPSLLRQHDGSPASEFVAAGLKDYAQNFGRVVTPGYWQTLFKRTLDRDAGAENWNRLEIYLSDKPQPKNPTQKIIDEAIRDDFSGLENLILQIKDLSNPGKDECAGVWALALTKFQQLAKDGMPAKRAARRVRQYLLARAPFLAPSRDALWIAFKRKIAALQKENGDLSKATADGRAGNGDRVEIPQADIDRLQWSVSHLNGGSEDASWREEYPLLSETTRSLYDYSFKMPPPIRRLVNPELADALTARHEGKRALRRKMPKLRRDWTGVPSMHSWVVDDKTSDVECALKNRDGSVSLIRPQIIAVMDSASRKFVGWTVSSAKAPNARIVCDAVKTGYRIHGVPKRIGVENGFVFGKSALVNGKEDDFGRTLVVGLAHFGCELDHFEKMNPTSKSELEYGFRQLDRLMERWPGYGGPIQMLSDFEDFKREKILIEAGKVEPTKFRMTLDEFIVEFQKVILKYNATQQQGRLNGLSPDESFAAGKNQNNPPINLEKLEWMLSDRELVHIGLGGAKFTYRATREKIHVTGGALVNFVGQDLWALMDPRDTSIVTFMNKDYTQTFTMETSEEVHGRQKDFDPGSETLSKERAKIREHERAINNKYLMLQNQFGNPRRDLLAEIRKQPPASANQTAPPVRGAFIPRKMDEAGKQMQAQRAEITAAKDQKTRRTAANKSKGGRLGVPSVMIEADEQTSRALELLRAGSRGTGEEIESTNEA